MLAATEPRELLPHAGDMLLIDRVLRCDDEEVECQTLSHRIDSNPLRLNASLPIFAGIEYGAQAAGIHGGWRRRGQTAATTPAAGMLVSCARVSWSVTRLDLLPSALHIHARVVAVTPAAWSYAVRIEHESQPVMHAELVIALANAGANRS